MNHEPHTNALMALIASWGVFLSSLVVKAIPFLQALSLILAMSASIYAIRYYRSKTK